MTSTPPRKEAAPAMTETAIPPVTQEQYDKAIAQATRQVYTSRAVAEATQRAADAAQKVADDADRALRDSLGALRYLIDMTATAWPHLTAPDFDTIVEKETYR